MVEVSLADCPVGLFWHGAELCLKTEYGNNEGRIDAFIVSSGEFFWGDAPQTIARQRRQMVRPVDTEAAFAALSQQSAGEWQPIESAPVNTPVEVRLGEGMTIMARLMPDASITTEGQSCDQWQAEHEGEHPDCWTDGCCWESNADEQPSLHPTAWRYPAPPQEQDSRGGGR